MTLREAILLANNDLAYAALSPAERAQVSSVPNNSTSLPDTIAFKMGDADPRHFYYANDGVDGQITRGDRHQRHGNVFDGTGGSIRSAGRRWAPATSSPATPAMG